MDRLVASPVFVLCSIRSGSTLLRCILDTHSRICAPHELHLADLQVRLEGPYVQLAMEAAGLTCREIEHLLWDRLMHQQLRSSNADIIVDKTPGNLLLWRRISECWPDARYIFLHRHPARILASALRNRSRHQSPTHVTKLVHRYLTLLDEARGQLDGISVRYEDLTAQPTPTMRTICEHLDVEWEPEMLEYGIVDHGQFIFGIGDFGEAIRSGRICPPDDDVTDQPVPESLREFCLAQGYPT